MNKVSISRNKVDFCYKNNCISFKGEIIKLVTFGVAAVVVISSITSFFENSK